MRDDEQLSHKTMQRYAEALREAVMHLGNDVRRCKKRCDTSYAEHFDNAIDSLERLYWISTSLHDAARVQQLAEDNPNAS